MLPLAPRSFRMEGTKGVYKHLPYPVYNHATYFKLCDDRAGAACADIHQCWEAHQEPNVSNSRSGGEVGVRALMGIREVSMGVDGSTWRHCLIGAWEGRAKNTPGKKGRGGEKKRKNAALGLGLG